MIKLSLTQKNLKYIKQTNQKNSLLLLALKNITTSELKFYIQNKILNKTNNIFKTKIKKKCIISSNNKNYYSYVGLSKSNFKKLCNNRLLPGWYKK
uniref:Ribosomal protein S14 n=1 Tax=Piridium sociabile TaxID=2570542 RepID=A0A5B9XVT1_9ALVE|nr:ribosomal protein S14 [Piridium sociabile]